MPPAARGARWRAAAGVAAGVLLLHVAALEFWPRAPGPGWQRERSLAVAPLQVRQIAAPTALDADAPISTAPLPTASARTQRRQLTHARPAPAAASAAPALVNAADAQPPPATSSDLNINHNSDLGHASVPVYATRPPAPATLRYELRRAGQQGHAVLRWQTSGDAFELTLDNEWPGGSSGYRLGSASRGHLVGSGLAPERHTESRRGRDLRAVNFQYDSARITFSGPGVELPLVSGAQDRLSWMLQLAAIAAANPALHAAGSEIELFVVGSRGDAQVWTFSVLGSQDIEVPAGSVAQALHLRREAAGIYDTQAEVWLDPARGHLPARLRLVVRPTGEATEFALESVQTDPKP